MAAPVTYSPRATLLASATAGVIARFPMHPIDTCKARLQAQGKGCGSGGRRPYTSLADALLRTARAEVSVHLVVAGCFSLFLCC